MRLKFTLLGALLLGSALFASAAELDKKQTGILSRLSNQVTAAQAALGKYSGTTLPYTQRVNDDFAKKLARFEEMIAPLPADNDEVKKEAAHLDEFRRAVAVQAATFASGTAAKEEVQAKMVATLEGPAAEADLDAMKQLGEMFGSAKRFELDFYGYSRWPTHQMVAELRGWSEAWPAAQKRHAELVSKYEEAAEYKGHLDGKPALARANIAISLRALKREYPLYKEAIEKFQKGAPAQLDADAAALKAEADRAVAAKNYAAFLANEGKIEALSYRVTNLANVWAPLAAGDEERKAVDARAKAAIAQVEAAMDKLASEIIRDNKGPKDKYTGDDRGKLEAYVRSVWAKHFPKETIAAVRFGGGAFERAVAWTYDPAARAFVKSDTSSLPVWVVVKDGGKQAVMWFSTLRKLHLRGNELQLHWIDRPSRGPLPSQRLFLANL